MAGALCVAVAPSFGMDCAGVHGERLGRKMLRARFAWPGTFFRDAGFAGVRGERLPEKEVAGALCAAATFFLRE